MIEALLSLILQSGLEIERFLVKDVGLSSGRIQYVLRFAAAEQDTLQRARYFERTLRQSRERSAALRQRVDAILRDRAQKAAEAQEPDLPK